MTTLFSIELIISCFLISWFITIFEPIQNYLYNKCKWGLLIKVLTCIKCTSLWTTLFIGILLAVGGIITYMSVPFSALTTSFIANIYDKLINK